MLLELLGALRKATEVLKPMNQLFMESGGSHYHPALKLVIGLAVVGVVVATGYRLGSWPGLGLPRPYPHSVSVLIKKS